MAVTVQIDAANLDAAPGRSLFDCAEELGVRVPTSCLKQGKCRECLVEVTEGQERLTPRSAEEKHLGANFRLSCRARIAADSGNVKCHTLRRGTLRISGSAEGLPRAENARFDPAVTRRDGRVLLDGIPIADSAGPLHGLAVDIGTTTVVLRMIDLESGAPVAAQSFENPQRFAGSDVMARIKYDTDHGGRLLQRALIGYMNHAIAALPVDPRTIYEVVVAGNAAMRDLFFGLNVHSIGQKPYRSITEHEMRDGKRATTGLSVTAKSLRLAVHPDARVVGLPLVGCHVGADAAACLLAIDLAHEDRTVALMDIGTNTELIVGNRQRVLAASCPAGPAFEGGAISRGMPALDGAIEGVRIGADGRIETRVIGGGTPAGICGSGLVEALGELLRTGRMNGLGRFEDGEGRAAIDAEHGIFLEENDVSLLAQAKGANVAGLHIVMKNFGIDFNELDCFYLAGGFGRHLSVDAARRIGLIPNLPDSKIVQIGNSAIEGAAMALKSASRRRELEEMVRGIQHVELETDPDFFDYFVEGCQFIPVESSACRQ